VLDVTRPYEVVYIFDSALDEAAVNERLGRFHALLGQGVQPSVNHWGKRTLAFPIKRHETGYYVVTQFDAEPTVLPEFERAIKLEEGVVRFLSVIKGPDVTIPVRTDKDGTPEEDDE
jgi:small subunit ribosomal protein S6